MINSSMDVTELFKSLPKRADGRLLIAAWTACLVLLSLNLFTPATIALGLQSSGKWITLWATWPFVLFVGYLRLRTLFDGSEFIVLVYHALLIPGSVVYFTFKNLEVL